MTDVTSSRLLKRRTFSAGLLAAPAVLSHIKVGRAADLRPLRLMQQQPIYVTDYLNIIAMRTDIFARHGIAPEIVPNVSPILPLLTGACDITSIGSANALVAVAKKQDLMFVCANVPRPICALSVKVDSPLLKDAHKWPAAFQALKGKTIGVTIAGALFDQLAHWLVILAGMTPDKDITIQAAGDANLLLANLQKGVYDAALLPSPLFEIAAERKISVNILDFWNGEGPPEMVNFPSDTPAAMRSFVEKNPGLIQDYFDSQQEASAFSRNPANRAAITGIIAKELQVDPKTLASGIETFVHVIGDCHFTRQQWDASIAMTKANGVVKEDYVYEKYVFAGARG